MTKKFRVGSNVMMSDDALDNYGEKYRGRLFKVTHVATKYMPAKKFFDSGKPSGYHPGFDEEAGCALYDLKDAETGKELDMSLYEWELKPYGGGGRR